VSAREKLALAADLPLPEALQLYSKVRPHVGVVKVGLSLFVEHGPAAVRAFQAEGANVFLDLKLHDIPNTVELAAQKAGALGVSFLTVHAQGGSPMVQAACDGARRGAAEAGKPAPVILAVTVLTALSADAVRQTGHVLAPPELASKLGALAVKAGAQGLVCSPHEAAQLKALLGPEVFLCTPGIRPAGAAPGDQARAETPAFAVRAGANLLVIGRPIHAAEDPLAAARAIEAEVAALG